MRFAKLQVIIYLAAVAAIILFCSMVPGKGEASLFRVRLQLLKHDLCHRNYLYFQYFIYIDSIHFPLICQYISRENNDLLIISHP
jgi:hypothetical protein